MDKDKNRDKDRDRDEAQTVAVTGGTGFVGRRVVACLLQEGWRVRALVRSEPKARSVFDASALNEGRLELCRGTLDDPDALRHLVQGSAACVHLVGIIRQTRQQSFEQVHVDGTHAIVETCRSHDPSMRLVHMSALGVGPDRRVGYRDTKHRGEQIVRKSGLRWTIIRPGLIHGPGGEFTTMAVNWVRGKAPPYLFLPYFSRWKRGGIGFEAPLVAPVFVDDVARVFVASLRTDASIGKVYELVGSQRLRFPEMLRAYARHLRPRPRDRVAIGIPWFIAALQARLAGYLGLGGLLPFDEGMAVMGGRDAVADNGPVEADFGFRPAEFETSLQTYADRF